MLDRLFNFDNPVMRFLSRTFDMMILNILFIICSIPVITIGASLSAVHYACLKMKDEDEGYVLRNFFKSFKMNFKQGTVLWLIMFVLGGILCLEYKMTGQMTGGPVKQMKVAIFMAAVIWYMILSWMFALQSRFVNTIGGTIKNAVLLTFAKAPRSIAMVLIFVLEMVVAVKAPPVVQSYSLLYLLMFGFSVQVLINTQLQYQVIKSLMPEEKEEAPAADNAFTVDEQTDVSELGYTPLPKDDDGSADDTADGSADDAADGSADDAADGSADDADTKRIDEK